MGGHPEQNGNTSQGITANTRHSHTDELQFTDTMPLDMVPEETPEAQG